jgi:hypothetical protein
MGELERGKKKVIEMLMSRPPFQFALDEFSLLFGF